MNDSRVYFHWSQPEVASRFSNAVSLHSHTLHSHECLGFIRRATRNVPYLSAAIRKHDQLYQDLNQGRTLDLTRAWWTPPLGEDQALRVEEGQIRNVLGLNALVSLSDHDNMWAGRLLGNAPISVEWTVPFRGTFFHLGIHNVPSSAACDWMAHMEEFTARPSESRLSELLEMFNSRAETLVVLNHPVWDEKGIGRAAQGAFLSEFLAQHTHALHALELNGLRPWHENNETIELGRAVDLPVISGGDRHAREPNACLNLTHAATFAEFVEEIRRDGHSEVLFMPQYREPFKLRIIKSMCEVMREDPHHGKGWTRWSDRVFYLCDDGVARSLSELWATKIPTVVNQFVALSGLVGMVICRPALRSSPTAFTK